MYEKVKDFAAEWRIESEKTAQLLEALTDESLSQRVAEGRWTLGEIAWHLVQSLHYMTYMGLSFPAPPSEEPASAAKIAEVYRKISGELLHVVMRSGTTRHCWKAGKWQVNRGRMERPCALQ